MGRRVVLMFPPLLLVVMALGLSPVQAQPRGSTATPNPGRAEQIPNQTQSSTPAPQPLPNAQLGAPTQRVDSLQNDIALLRERVDVVAGRTNLLITILAAVLALGGMTSLISWGRHEFGQSKRDRASDELRALYVKGETGAQQRSDEVHRTFLAGSKNTLELVNQTLTLAKEASERAAKSVEGRAKTILHKLDIDSKELLDSVPSQDDRALVADPARTATLRSLAQRIEGFQFQRIVLPEEMVLSTECLFVRGMDFHLKQQYDDAFEAWKEVTHRNDTNSALRSRAWYWIGYEQNNLGLFKEAGLSFQRALENAVGVRKYELQRLLIESRFFNKEPTQPLLDGLQAVVNSAEGVADDGMDSVRKRIFGTMGNIYLQMGNNERMADGVERSKTLYELAREQFAKASESDKWALFGLAEALYWLGDPGARDILKDQVRPKAVDEEIRRIEPRTKVLAKITELICCIRVPDLISEIPAIYSQVTEALGRVEGRLTVYSQMQRRNVSKEEFRRDLSELMDEQKTART